MFSKELESLIQATLEDGVLEDYEKAALVKRAQAEGVDLTELEIYINSLLQKRKRELNEKKEAEYAQIEKEKKEAIGKVCPKCGRQVTPLTLVCECGFEFTTKAKKSTVEDLTKRIEKVRSGRSTLGSDFLDRFKEESRITKEISEIITTFPVPNTKEDIMEFLALAAPNSKLKGGMFGTLLGRLKLIGACVIVLVVFVFIVGGGLPAVLMGFYGCLGGIAAAYLLDQDTLMCNKIAQAWRAKFDQVMMKGRSLRVDAEFTRMLDYYEKQVNV